MFSFPNLGIFTALSGRRWATILVASAFSLSSTGCVFFNTYYNADKAYRQAMKMRAKRLDKNPADSVLATPEEKLKFERCVTKCSKVLELYPDQKEWQGKAVFLMAEAYYQEGEWIRAVGKYDEFIQYFPKDEKITRAEVHRAIALFENGQYLASRSALDRMLLKPLPVALRTEALLCLARLEGVEGSSESTLAAYEKLLREAAKSPIARAQAHAAAARLAYDLKKWDKVRIHALAPEIDLLSVGRRLAMATLAVDALYQQKKYAEGIAELQPVMKVKALRDSLAPVHLKLAEGYLALRQSEQGFAQIAKVAEKAPRTSWAAEGWYRRGDHELLVFRDEAAAKTSFDSAAAQGMDFAYAQLGRERSEALARLADYRDPSKTPPVDSSAPWRNEFMISELFLFQLDQVDSALVRLDSIADSPRRDSTFTKRAAYARAYIREEYLGEKQAADSLYRQVMERYPGTAFAQQAERNLGLKPTVQTAEDSAHALFLAAEKLRFGGAALDSQVIPAYAEVVAGHAYTASAAKAQFVIAMLYEGDTLAATGLGEIDSAKAAYAKLRDDYPKSIYAPIAQAKLLAAGFTGKPVGASPQGAGQGMPPAADSTRSAPRDSLPANPPLSGQGQKPSDMRGRPHVPDESPPSQPSADSSEAPDGKTKEILEPDYDDVDQY